MAECNLTKGNAPYPHIKVWVMTNQALVLFMTVAWRLTDRQSESEVASWLMLRRWRYLMRVHGSRQINRAMEMANWSSTSSLVLWHTDKKAVSRSESQSWHLSNRHIFPQWVFLNSWPGSCVHDQYQLSRVKKGKSRDVSVENVCTVLLVASIQSVYFYFSSMVMLISHVCAAVRIKYLRQKQNTIVYLILQDHTPTEITDSQMWSYIHSLSRKVPKREPRNPL